MRLNVLTNNIINILNYVRVFFLNEIYLKFAKYKSQKHIVSEVAANLNSSNIEILIVKTLFTAEIPQYSYAHLTKKLQAK